MQLKVCVPPQERWNKHNKHICSCSCYLNSTKVIHFGGYNTPKCKLAISLDGKYFYLKKLNSTCVKMTNSKGVKIICNSDKSVCKTRTELIDFVQNNTQNSSTKQGIVTGLDPNGDGFLALRSKPKDQEIGRLYNNDKVKILANSNKTGWAYGKWIKVTNNKNLANNNPKENKQEILSHIPKYDSKIPVLESISKKLRMDKKFFLDAVKKNSYALKYADDSLKKYKDIFSVLKQ